MHKEENLLGKVTHQSIGWRIEEVTNFRTNRQYNHCRAVCRTCEMDMASDTEHELHCTNPLCKNNGKSLKITKPYEETKQIVISMFEARERRKEKEQWINFDQEFVQLAEGKDKDDDYWCTVRLLQTKQGKMAMVLIGQSGHKSKIQFFVKDELDQVTFDQVGDLKPSELLIAFKAQFSDGSTTETNYNTAKKD